MHSPFPTAQAYLEATGTLHSFTGHPATAAIFIGLSLAVTVYFLVRSFTIHH